jgi:hypothetical protein
MQMRDLIKERLLIIRRNVEPDDLEEFISSPLDYADISRLNEGTIEAHGYLEGAADAINMTVIEMLDELGIDLYAPRRIERPAHAHRRLPAPHDPAPVSSRRRPRQPR